MESAAGASSFVLMMTALVLLLEVILTFKRRLSLNLMFVDWDFCSGCFSSLELPESGSFSSLSFIVPFYVDITDGLVVRCWILNSLFALFGCAQFVDREVAFFSLLRLREI